MSYRPLVYKPLFTMKTKKILLYAGAVAGTLLVALIIYLYPFTRFFLKTETKPINDNLTLVTGGGNSGILVTDSAVVVIDTKMWKPAKKLHNMVEKKAGNKKVIVINTHLHGDHTFGNHLYKGAEILIGGYAKDLVNKEMNAENRPTVFISDSLILNLGSETVRLYDMGQGHTFHDLVVYLEKSKTLFTGDLVFNRINPALIRADGTDIDKWKAILTSLPERFDIKTVVPGHGDAGGIELITSLKQYFDDMQAAVANPEEADALKEKYAGWKKMPMMSSPGRTMEFIRETAK